MVWSTDIVSKFHNVTFLSNAADARVGPSAKKATHITPSVRLQSVPRAAPDCGHQSRIARPPDTEARSRPSGEKVTHLRGYEWPSSTPHAAPVLAFQSLTVPSCDAEVRRFPPGENFTSHTMSVWPSRMPRAAPVVVSQSLTVLSLNPDASSRSSGDNATAFTKCACPSRFSHFRLQSSLVIESRVSQRGSSYDKACRIMLFVGANTSAETYACSGASSIMCWLLKTNRLASARS